MVMANKSWFIMKWKLESGGQSMLSVIKSNRYAAHDANFSIGVSRSCSTKIWQTLGKKERLSARQLTRGIEAVVGWKSHKGRWAGEKRAAKHVEDSWNVSITSFLLYIPRAHKRVQYSTYDRLVWILLMSLQLKMGVVGQSAKFYWGLLTLSRLLWPDWENPTHPHFLTESFHFRFPLWGKSLWCKNPAPPKALFEDSVPWPAVKPQGMVRCTAPSDAFRGEQPIVRSIFNLNPQSLFTLLPYQREPSLPVYSIRCC